MKNRLFKIRTVLSYIVIIGVCVVQKKAAQSLTLTILIFLPFFAFGQKSLWAIDALFSPDSYASPQVEADAAIYQESAYHLGFNVVKDLKEEQNWSFRTGLRYSVYNKRIEGFSTSQSFTFYSTTTFLNVPLALRYSFGQKKLRLYGEIVGSFNFQYDIFAKNANVKTNPSWGLALGLEYQVTPTFGFFTQPTFNKPLKRNNDYLFMLGFETGIKFRLSQK